MPGKTLSLINIQIHLRLTDTIFGFYQIALFGAGGGIRHEGIYLQPAFSFSFFQDFLCHSNPLLLGGVPPRIRYKTIFFVPRFHQQ